MNKKMSRFISALLVVAMVCAMVPAVFAAVTGVTINGAPSGEVAIGYTATLTATVTGGDGTGQTVEWSSSAPNIVSVDNGTIKALAAGTATITATITDTPTQSASCTITVKSAVPVTDVKLNKDVLTLTVGDTETLTATVEPNNATNNKVTWSSNNEAVATVSNGTVTAVSAGTATITAASEENPNIKATCTVTVNRKSLTISQPQVCEKTVAVGTAFADLGLPATGEITVSSSTKVTYTINWSSTGYNKDTVGKYILKGTPSLKGEDAKNYELTTTEVTADITVADKPTVKIDAPQDLTILKGEKDAGKRTLTASVTAMPTGAEKTIEWYKSSSKYSGYTKIDGATSEALVIADVSTVGKTYYICKAKASNGSVESDWEQSAPITVEVVEQYRITLTTNKGATSSDAAVIGTNPSIQATVEEYKDGQFKPVNGGTISWSVSVSNMYAAISSSSSSLNSSGKNTAILTTIGTRDKSVMKVTVTAKVYGTYTQDLDIYVKPGAAETITFQTVGGGATFSEDTFWTAVAYATNSRDIDFDYVKFDTTTDGSLYTDSSMKTSVGTKECYYDAKSYELDLDGLYFVPKANAKKPSVTYTAYNSVGTIIAYGTVSIGSSAGDIVYETSANQSVKFDEADFQKFFATAYNRGTLSYVNFDVKYDSNLNTRAYGYLYESSDRNADYVRENRDYTYDATSRQYDLDTIVFTAGTRTSKYTVTVPFTAYGTEYNRSRTVAVNGYVTISVNDGKATTIYSTGASFKGDLYKAMIPDNYTEREVKGFYVEFGTVTGGKLFYDYKTIASAKEVTSKTVFFFDAGRNELDLSDVYFVPEAGAKTAKVTYTIYSSKTKVDTGALTFTVIQQTKSNYFSDVTESNTGKWSANSIDFMSANELVTGTAVKTFSPNQTMTRAMLVTILYRVADKPSVKNVSNPFKDVKEGSYYYDAVLWAYKNNIVTGTSSTTFNPNGAVTREQIAAILYRYAGSPKTTGSLRGYTDQGKVSTYATTAMEWAVRNGIITGKSATTLDPTGKGTRAEVAVMLHRYLTK